MDRERLERALIAADRAGDTEAAKKLAQALRSAQPKAVSEAPKSDGTFAGGVVRGARDPIDGGAALLARGARNVFADHSLFSNLVKPFLPVGANINEVLDAEVNRVDGINTEAEREYQKEWGGENKGFDVGRLVGNVAATLPIGAAGMSGKSGLLGGFGKAAGTGAAVNALQPTESGDDFASDKLMQIGVGAAGGILGQAGGNAVSRIINPKSSEAVKKLIDEGVTPTPGGMLGGMSQRIEQAATSVPLLGDVIKAGQTRSIKEFNRAAVNRALNPIGVKLPKNLSGNDAVVFAKETLGKKFDDLAAQITVTADKKLANDLTTLVNGVESFHEPAKQKVGEILFGKIGQYFKTGRMEGKALQGLREDLRLASEKFMTGGPDDRVVSETLAKADDILQDVLERSAGPLAAEVKGVRRGWANYARVRDAASKVTAEDGIFSPEQLRASSRLLDKSKGKGRSAEGTALMQDLADAGVKALGKKVPDSGTPLRLAVNASAGGSAGTALASGLLDPATAALVASAAAPYTKFGQLTASKLLRSRPELAGPLSEAISKGSPLLGAPALLQLLAE